MSETKQSQDPVGGLMPLREAMLAVLTRAAPGQDWGWVVMTFISLMEAVQRGEAPKTEAMYDHNGPRASINEILASHAWLEKRLAEASIGISNGSYALESRTAETLDAERYRYLRNIAGQVAEDDDGPMVCDGLGDNFDFLRGVEVDASVDAAMAAWKAAGRPTPVEPT